MQLRYRHWKITKIKFKILKYLSLKFLHEHVFKQWHIPYRYRMRTSIWWNVQYISKLIKTIKYINTLIIWSVEWSYHPTPCSKKNYNNNPFIYIQWVIFLYLHTKYSFVYKHFVHSMGVELRIPPLIVRLSHWESKNTSGFMFNQFPPSVFYY